jgi:DNA primase small subunit
MQGKDGLFGLYKHHYEHTDLSITDIQRREIATQEFSPQLSAFNRAQYFLTKESLVAKLIENSKPPAGLFSSTAYYLDPNESKPTKRGLIGYDFVIDLDDDALAYEDRYDFIDTMRKKTKAVVDRFLKDLGFDEDLMLVDFSGNKGFHLTFDDEKYRNLDQSDRRQIIDYIIGNKLDRDILLVNNKLSHYGWNKQAVYFLESLLKDPSREHIEKYFPKNKAKKIDSLLSDPAVVARLTAGSLIDFDTKVLKLAMMKEHRLNIKNVVDKKPTVDKHRIFRVPGSLHPKSGLPSVRLSKHHLDSTDAIIDEIMILAGEDMVTITIGEDVEIDFPRKTVFTEGTHTVPRYEALCILTKECKKHWN